MVATKRVLILVPIAGAVVAIALLAARARQAESPAAVCLSGTVEVTDAEVSFRIAGRVLERLVSEGEAVTAGQVLGRLDSTELRQAVALRQAETRAAEAALAELEAGSRAEDIAGAAAGVQAAEARLAELEAGSRPQEVAVAEAAAELAKADERYTRTEDERNQKLLSANVVSPQEAERTRLEHERALARLAEASQTLALLKEGPRQEQIAQARAVLAETRQTYERVRNGPRPETIAQAKARVEQARASLDLAETQLGYATLTSPLTGTVLTDPIEAGEYVAPGTPVVSVADLHQVWLRGYISETDLGRVKLGMPAEVTTDTYPGKTYAGTLSFIAADAEFTPRAVQTTKERVTLVYRVKIDIPNPDQELKPGMPADARLRLPGDPGASPGRHNAAVPGAGARSDGGGG